ncbi:MAG: hypothetical protein R3E95_06505 [Thiolinea sp.]
MSYRRGIAVKVQDAANGFFALTLGGKTVCCRERCPTQRWP